jgi:hypothetical protein
MEEKFHPSVKIYELKARPKQHVMEIYFLGRREKNYFKNAYFLQTFHANEEKKNFFLIVLKQYRTFISKHWLLSTVAHYLS